MEIHRVVKAPRNGRAGNMWGMKTEDPKKLPAIAESEEEARTKGEEGYEGRSNTWRIFVRPEQHVWETGGTPQHM